MRPWEPYGTSGDTAHLGTRLIQSSPGPNGTYIMTVSEVPRTLIWILFLLSCFSNPQAFHLLISPCCLTCFQKRNLRNSLIYLYTPPQKKPKKPDDSPTERILSTGQQVQRERHTEEAWSEWQRSVWPRALGSGRRWSQEGRQRMWTAWGRGERVPLLILSFRGFSPLALPGAWPLFLNAAED